MKLPRRNGRSESGYFESWPISSSSSSFLLHPNASNEREERYGEKPRKLLLKLRTRSGRSQIKIRRFFYRRCIVTIYCRQNASIFAGGRNETAEAGAPFASRLKGGHQRTLARQTSVKVIGERNDNQRARIAKSPSSCRQKTSIVSLQDLLHTDAE